MAIPYYGQNKDGDSVDELATLQQGFKISTAKSAWTAIPVAHGSTDIAAITQPANTVIKDIIIVSDSILSSSGVSGDGMDVSIGTAAGGAQIMALCEILDDGGAAVHLQAYHPMYLVENCRGQAANWAAPHTATSEATSGKLVAGLLDIGAEREIHVRFDVIDADLGAAGNVQVIVNFLHYHTL